MNLSRGSYHDTMRARTQDQRRAAKARADAAQVCPWWWPCCLSPAQRRPVVVQVTKDRQNSNGVRGIGCVLAHDDDDHRYNHHHQAAGTMADQAHELAAAEAKVRTP
eukprot:COSAG01_NODE_2851_length_6937_cov_13.682228_2_plen_107_part_00